MDPSSKFLSLLSLSLTIFLIITESHGIGVNYGMVGNNLPTPDKVVSLCKSRNIDMIRLFNPNPQALRALHGSGMQVVLGTMNEDLEVLARDAWSAVNWVNINVIPHVGYVWFRYITAGNEVIHGELGKFVLPAMRNLNAALRKARLQIPVTTVVSQEVLGVSYPPSRTTFSSSSASLMIPIIAFLNARRTPLLFNVYPYYAYASNPQAIRLDYALSSSEHIVIHDGQFGYTNLLDAMVDGMYWAVENAGGPHVSIVVSETGWPSQGGSGANVENARTYNNNMAWRARMGTGTPKRPWERIEMYLFAMFNENGKTAGIEQNFGLYHANMTEVYHVQL